MRAAALSRSRAGRKLPASRRSISPAASRIAGVAAIIYTDIGRDGMLKGLDFEGTRALADALAIPVIASGGLASLDDIETLLRPENRRIAGAISGRGAL